MCLLLAGAVEERTRGGKKKQAIKMSSKIAEQRNRCTQPQINVIKQGHWIKNGNIHKMCLVVFVPLFVCVSETLRRIHNWAEADVNLAELGSAQVSFLVLYSCRTAVGLSVTLARQ